MYGRGLQFFAGSLRPRAGRVSRLPCFYPTVEPIAKREGLLIFPHVIHIDMLKEHAYRGHTVFVWSAGGPIWARSVVERLDIGKYIDAVLPKPDWFYDDHTVDHFMPEINRIWKEPI